MPNVAPDLREPRVSRGFRADVAERGQSYYQLP